MVATVLDRGACHILNDQKIVKIYGKGNNVIVS